MNKILTLGTVALGLTLVACKSHEGWIMSEDEGDLPGSRKAGIETFDRLVAGVTRDFLSSDAIKAEVKDNKRCVAFVGIQNMSAEELGDNRESMYELIDTVIVGSRMFTSVSKDYVDAALSETGLRVEDLFLQKGHTEFLSVLRAKGAVPDYLLFGKLTSASSQGEDERQRNYMLTLQLVNAETGIVIDKKTERVRKGYSE
ncbi:MAG: hypothetical protein HUU29_13650 [Planctomycetaceae bacterium]|nr:hypothetical protein [Planctomycetaceae bacterium]